MTKRAFIIQIAGDVCADQVFGRLAERRKCAPFGTNRIRNA